MRILLVDDDPRQVTVLHAHLEPLNHTLLTASGGEEALLLIEDQPVDLILLDLRMPGIDGIDVLHHIRARPELERMPVVLITSMHEREARLRAIEAGANDFVEKPPDGAILRARVTNLLRLKQLGDDLERRNEDLRRLEALRRELADLVVHDLKAPVAGAALNIEVAMEILGLEEGPACEALKDALAGVHRIQHMTEELLLLARLEEAKMPLRPVRGSLRRIVEDVVRALGRTAERRGTQLDVSVEGDLAATADPDLIRRVIENLLDNAMRHAPRGGRIAVRGVHGTSELAGGLVSLSVANSGNPIPEGDRSRIFQKFAQSSGTVARGANMGLGLHFCQVVASAHGGSIRVEETPEWPVVFTLCLPG
ncbi:MAG: hybrid sensor histidine kinase/response regulator [Pseudomonadota bacterium]|nr:hybrid sensor histidine kinase/response regulator [Pseudomonadota bacterium]